MTVERIKEKGFKIDDNKLTIVEFFTDWCSPCKFLTPILEKISKDDEDIDILRIDIDENRELAHSFKIKAIPLMLFCKDGVVIDKDVLIEGFQIIDGGKLLGAIEKDILLEIIEELVE